MPKRIDHKTKNRIPDDSYYFNTDTGEALPAEHVIAPPVLKQVVQEPVYESLFQNPFKKKKEKKHEDPELQFPKKDNSKMISIFSVIIIIGSLGFMGLYLYVNLFNKPVSVVETVTQSPVKLLTTVEIENKLGTGSLTTPQLASSVPENVYLYVESPDMSGFLRYYVKQENISSEFQNRANNLLKQNFAVFAWDTGSGIAWSFIFLPKDIGVTTEAAAAFSHPEWKALIVSDVLVVSNNSNVFQAVGDVKKNLAPSVAQNAEYVRSKTKLGNTGEALIIFVNKTSGPRLLESITSANLSPELVEIIMAVLDTKLNELIIKKN